MHKFLFFLLLFSINLNAQVFVNGKVLFKNKPLEGAAVYINNTMVGTTTNANGEFQIKTKEGKFNLIISFLGFKTINYSLDTKEYKKPLIFSLIEEENLLDEIIIKKTKYNDEWKYNLSRFKTAFLGRTKFAKECSILNPKTLHFEYNSKNGELTAFAREPLKIKHKALGYLIIYDLVSFSEKRKRLFFSGYARYSNLKKKVKKRWKRNRLEAYYGSQMHFLRSLLKNNLTKDGFVVNQFIRKLNPKRPTDAEIKSARQLIQLNRKAINFSKIITNPITPLDSALVIVKKASIPKYADYLYKQNVPYKDMISFNNNPYLDFKNHLSIIYKNEKEEEDYLIGMFGKRKKPSGVQSSNIVLTKGKSIIDLSGVLTDPNAIFVEGYWAYESFANMLPFDYVPQKD